MMKEIPFREATMQEQEILRKLLEVNFQGVEELRQQLPGIRVRKLDSEGSLELMVEHRISANVKVSVPVEASYSDVQNPDLFAPRVRILLNVFNGLMHELEIYKDDGGEILRSPETDELLVDVNEAPAQPI